MRVLLLSDFYPPVAGGIEQHVQTLAHGLATRGHQVAVASIAGHGDPGGATDDGPIRIHRLASLVSRLPGAHLEGTRPFAPPAPDPLLAVGLARVARSFRPDLVHAHTWLAHSWLPGQAVRRRPLVVTLHEYGLACARKDLVYRGATCSGPGLRKCLACAAGHYGPGRGLPMAVATLVDGPILRRAADQLIVVSEAVARGSGLRPGEATVIPNMLPSDKPSLPPALAAQLPTRPFILFVGALGEHKGIGVLFDAWRRLAATRQDLPALVCIGHRWHDTPRDVPAGVTLLEDWPHAAVLGAWALATVGVIPSTWPEPFGIVALEAMAAGRPVIASRIGGLADVVQDEVTGLLVEPGEPGSLAGAIERLLDDEALRSRLGLGGRLAAADYAVDRVVPQIEAVYGAARDARHPHVRMAADRPPAPGTTL